MKERMYTFAWKNTFFASFDLIIVNNVFTLSHKSACHNDMSMVLVDCMFIIDT